MNDYIILKYLHILSAVIVAGTGTGIAFFMLMAYRSKNLQAIMVTTRHVILGDWLFTLPAVLMQFITGLMLMNTLGYSFSSLWFKVAILLFVFIGICWLPVLRIQYLLRIEADLCLTNGHLSPRFHRLMRNWILLGIPAFIAILIIFYWMIAKPYISS